MKDIIEKKIPVEVINKVKNYLKFKNLKYFKFLKLSEKSLEKLT